MSEDKQTEIKLYSRFKKEPYKVPSVCLIDTNVFLGGRNNIEEYSNPKQIECAEKCVQIMNLLHDRTIQNVVLDRTNGESEIFKEYCHNLDPYRGQYLAERILQELMTQGRLLYRKITPKNTGEYDYEEFPKHKDLANFDNSDRKFIAVSNAEEPHYPIIQSMDGKWWKWSKPLHNIGIEILFNHPDYAKELCKEKNKCKKDDCSECEL